MATPAKHLDVGAASRCGTYTQDNFTDVGPRDFDSPNFDLLGAEKNSTEHACG